MANAPEVPVRVGLIGTGWGVKVQVPQFRAAGMEISAIYSRDQSRAEELASKHSIPLPCSNVDDLINSDQVDVVSIVTPTYLHKPQFIAALHAGKHVLVDKPLCLNTEEAEQMAREAAQHPKQLVLVDHELRFTEMATAMRTALQRGDLGTVCTIRLNIFTPPFKTHFDWWSCLERGGGMLGAVGSHGIDILRFVTNGEITRVSAIITQLRKQLPNEEGTMEQVTADDYCCGTMVIAPRANTTPGTEVWWGEGTSLSSEIFVQFLFGAYGVPPAPIPPPMIIHGSKGCVMADPNTSSMKHLGTDGKVVSEVVGSSPAFSVTGSRGIGEALQGALGPRKDLSAVAHGATILDGLATVYVMDAIKESASKGGAMVNCKLLSDFKQ